MRRQQIEDFKAWFNDYVAAFYGDDDFVNANIKLKEDHSRRTCTEMIYLAKGMNLPDNQKRIAEVIALFHDIGRFEQFIRYRTYHDPKSVNHCLLGLEVLRQKKVLEQVEKTERELIEKAIEYHGLKELPEGLDGRCLLFSKLIRDADKIDVLYVVTEYYRQYRDEPGRFRLELELPDVPEYSDQVVKGILNGRRIDYNELRTMNDMKLCQLGWVYDVNFALTLKRIKQRNLLEKLVGFLPETPDVEMLKKKVFGYVDSRIENDLNI